MKITKNLRKEPFAFPFGLYRNEKRKQLKDVHNKNKNAKKPKILVKFPESVSRNSEIQALKEENEKLKEYNFELCQLLHKYDQFLLRQRPKEYEIDAMGIAALTKTTQPTVHNLDSSPPATTQEWETSSSGLSDYDDDLSDLFPNFQTKKVQFHPDKNAKATESPTPSETNLQNQFKEPSFKVPNKEANIGGKRGGKILKESRRCKHCGREFTWGPAHATHENSCNGIRNVNRKCDKCDFSVAGTIRECNDQLFRHVQISHSEVVRRKPKPEKRKRPDSGASSDESADIKITPDRAVLAVVNDDSRLMAQQDSVTKEEMSLSIETQKWQCDECLHVFSERWNLKRHQKNVPNCSKRMKFSCEFCDDFTTSTQKILTRHLNVCRKSPFQKFK